MGKCDDCNYLSDQKGKVSTVAERSAYMLTKQAHFTLQLMEGNLLCLRIEEAIVYPYLYTSVMFDHKSTELFLHLKQLFHSVQNALQLKFEVCLFFNSGLSMNHF
jgi:hypothetical protein